ncbi:MgtC/SapB family protein [Paenibacillus septentrionalis]|uniref:MgtC/SapB family protein n=1 Tax=Paenibacillus septentrionalis TaxID=429342 RepID=A0ABW1V1Y2_9BACL
MTNLNVWSISDMDLVIRLILSVILGGLVGIEREISNHSAGFRTHILVCLGSTTIMLLSIYGFSDFVDEFNVRMDPARLAAQVISGIGFLGAGAIMRNGNIIKGLTTAASLWVVAAIGLCIGAGFYKAAVISTVLVITTLFILNKCEKLLMKKRRTKQIELLVKEHTKAITQVLNVLDAHQAKVLNIAVASQEQDAAEAIDNVYVKLCITCKLPKRSTWLAIVEQLREEQSVISIKCSGEEYKLFGGQQSPVSF